VGTARHLIIRGRVQGIGFRWWATRKAQQLGLDGWVRNRSDGNVEILVIGAEISMREFAAACHHGPAGAVVQAVDQTEAEDDGSQEFTQLPTL
jgi:acylphosphatase